MGAELSSARQRLAVIVLNYGTPGLVVDCLASLEGEAKDGRADVVVVDNKSPDDSVERIGSAISQNGWGAWAQLIASPSNDGFSAGNNIGLRAVDADAYVLLNSDTIVREGAMERLWRAVSESRGIAGACLEWPDGEPQLNLRRWATPASEFARAARTGAISRSLGIETVDLTELERVPRDCWLSGACLAIHRDVIDAIGVLDDGFFMYYEDMDYCRRAVEAGFTVDFIADAHVVHLKGGTSPVQAQGSERKRRPAYYYAARTRYFAKHYGTLGLVAANGLYVAGRGLAWIRETLGTKAPHHCEREARDIWSHLANPLETWRPGSPKSS